MNSILKKVLTYVILPVAIIALAWLTVASINKPINFNKQKDFRETVAVQRLKDLRTLEVAYKSVHNRYTASFDSLKAFYQNGKMNVMMQVGSQDDSVAVANTAIFRKNHKGATPADMLEAVRNGEKLVFSVKSELPVKDTLFYSRKNFVIDSIGVIPFSGGKPVEMASVIKKVSGVDVPLFEAKMPYKELLKGLDNQLRINLDADRKASNRYEGLEVGSITSPNNNAGNWE